MADEAQEKTEKPTPRRKSKARKDGNVAQSPEVHTAFFLLLMVLYFSIMGGWMMSQFMANTERMLRDIGNPISFLSIRTTYVEALKYLAIVFGPIAVLLLASTFTSSFVQFGWLFAPKAFKMNWSQVFQFKNQLKNVFSMEALQRLVKSILKLVILLFISWMTVRPRLHEFMGLPNMEVQQIFAFAGGLVIKLLINILIAFIFIAIADFAITHYLHIKKLKMSKSEVKDERRQMEGDPQVKNKIRQLMFTASLKRMMKDVPKADVVITNPIHLAVAIRYDMKLDEAPIVIAKGKRLIAERIKELARENNIPIVEDKPLARLIYSSTEVGQQISVELYSAVAEILAYVYNLKNKRVM